MKFVIKKSVGYQNLLLQIQAEKVSRQSRSRQTRERRLAMLSPSNPGARWSGACWIGSGRDAGDRRYGILRTKRLSSLVQKSVIVSTSPIILGVSLFCAYTFPLKPILTIPAITTAPFISFDVLKLYDTALWRPCYRTLITTGAERQGDAYS